MGLVQGVSGVCKLSMPFNTFMVFNYTHKHLQHPLNDKQLTVHNEHFY